MVLRRLLIRFIFFLQKDRRLKYLKFLEKSSTLSYEELRKTQFREIRKLLRYCYQHVPFYKYWFDLHGVNIAEIKNLDDFSRRVPVLTKQDIIEHYTLFAPPKKMKYVNQSTGGSTGQTLRFRMSKKDHQLGVALLLRGMKLGGYKLGDRILVLAGGSLVNKSSKFKLNLLPRLLNQYKISSYGLEEQDFKTITKLVLRKNIQYLRGYASALYYLAEYCDKHSVEVSFNAVFSTAERLLDQQRIIIEKVFKCKVYNQYALNDGGVSAFEHNDEKGLVVDMERACLEVADTDAEEEGIILATSLYNYAFPFIRYDTGDRGRLQIRKLNSGIKRPVIAELLGRQTEFLLVNGRKIGGPVLTVLMGKTNAEQYRIIQKKEKVIEVQIKKGKHYSKKDEDFIKQSFKDNCGEGIYIYFTYLESFPNKNKHKFIMSELPQQG